VTRFRLRHGAAVRINEETLRDGEQTPHVIFLGEEKVAIARTIPRAVPGTIINAGYPAISPAEAEAVRAVALAVEGAEIECAGRATREDLNRCFASVAGAESPRVTFWFPASQIMTGSRLGTTPAGMLCVGLDLLAYGRDRVGDGMGISVALADASNADPGFLIEAVARLTEAGADMIVVCDTIGRWLPSEVTAAVRAILDAVPDAPLCIHPHNDLGMGTANAMAALAAGAPAVATAVNGLGERAGMPPTEEVVAALLLRGDAIGRTLEAESTCLLDLSTLVARASGVQPIVNKPVVGAGVLQRETGTQVDWMRRDARTFQLITPAFLGRDAYELVVGKMSSRESLAVGLASRGFDLDDATLETIFHDLKELSGRQRTISEDDLLRLVGAARAAEAAAPIAC
jgi:isopropylmalate/homocitrate/citramalate synthase